MPMKCKKAPRDKSAHAPVHTMILVLSGIPRTNDHSTCPMVLSTEPTGLCDEHVVQVATKTMTAVTALSLTGAKETYRLYAER